jgi:hypothetical protein
MDAETRCPAMVGKTPFKVNTYSARTLEPTVAIPAVSMVQSSDFVILPIYGLTVNADSTPTKILLAATSASAPDIFINLVKIREKSLIIKGIT